MTEVNRILDQMDRAFSGEAWHGPAVRELIDGLLAEDASKHVVNGAHSIWELVNHIAAWKVIVVRRLAGDIPEVTAEMDWPPVWEVSELAWKRSVENLETSHRRIRAAVEKLRDGELDESAGPNLGSRYVMIHGLIQHDLYHAGQIAIVKKALSAGDARR
jgi:uncharacterized damage-inducible protein DinB